MTKSLMILAACLLVLASRPAAAAPELILRGAGEQRVLTRSDLEQLPQTTIVTASPYFPGRVAFSGPSLARVLSLLDTSRFSRVTLKALNSYQVSATLEELLALDAIIATRRDGEPMAVRDLGPFWVMLPLSDRPELDSLVYHRFMVWQLTHIELE
jgi:hypothetical protein